MPRSPTIALALAAVLAAGCGGSSGSKLSTQEEDAARTGCPERAAVPEDGARPRRFPGLRCVSLKRRPDALHQEGTLGPSVADLALDGGLAWISAPMPHLVLGVDPHRGVVVKRLAIRRTPLYLAAGDGRLWVVAR